MNFLPVNLLSLYRDFKALEINDYNGIIRYYEQYEDAIRALDSEEYLECTLAYTNALFQTNNHGKHTVMCDHLLEIIIMQNIGTRGGDDLYERVLFHKAVSLFCMQEYPKAEHVLRELIKINPADLLPRRFLQKCLLHRKPAWLMKTRAACVGLSLLAALLIALELFVVRPFFEDWLRSAQIAHNLLIGASVGVFVIGEIRHAWRCRGEVAKFVENVKKRHATNESMRSPM